MLTDEQIKEVREHLETAQNPIFYYDNDADGLCSFLILRRFLGRGNGVAVRSYPDLDVSYARKARELNADYVFVLDKPVLSREFVEEINKMGLPFVWIDHHPRQVEEEYEKKIDNFYVYNPFLNSNSEGNGEPVTYLSYKLTERKEDLWIAMVGCIGDRFMPDFADEFKEKYSEYWGDVEDPFDAYFGTEIGKIVKAFNFGLKDSVSNVVSMQRFLISAENPGDVFAEVSSNRAFRKKYEEISRKYNSLLEKARNKLIGNLIFFEYGGETSMSSDIANELSYIYPTKYIVIIYRNGAVCNISMRGKKIRDILEKVLENFENATGGGHEDAVGARIKTDDLEKFKESMEQEVN